MAVEASEGMTKRKAHRKVSLSRCHPNNWNPNVMDATHFKKLKKGISRTLDQSGEIPPIVVRRSTQEKGKYEIIDGYHRWKALGELKQARVDVFVLKVDDATARILTNTLNYLRGTPDRAKQAAGLIEMIEMGASVDDLAELLPETDDELDMLMEEGTVSIKAYEQLLSSDETEGRDPNDDVGEDEMWVDLKFRVSVAQAKIIEKELARIGNQLSGKSKRSRALEYMAVMSGHSSIPEDVS